MENKDKLFEDLQYMKQIINDSRNLVVDNGMGYIAWGVIIILGLLGSFIDAINPGDQYSIVIWIGLIGIGWSYVLINRFRGKPKRKIVTFAGRIIGATWLAAGISMTIIGFIGTSAGAYNSVYISPIIATILGVAFYISALLYDNKIMKIIAPLWWLGSIYMFFYPGVHTILVMASMMLFLQLIPGIMIYIKYKSDRAVNE